jgi:hypothetical protein
LVAPAIIWVMSDHDNFEDRLRAMADQINKSVQRFTELDLDELAQRYGVDAEQARTFADTAGQWLNERLAGAEPFFGQNPSRGDTSDRSMTADLDDHVGRPTDPPPTSGASTRSSGPHPLDAPTEAQGLALAALDSGRWTVRPGSNQLSGTDFGPAPAGADIVGELRARDWIAVDGTLTTVGRHALKRWCRVADGDTAPRPA